LRDRNRIFISGLVFCLLSHFHGRGGFPAAPTPVMSV